MKLSELKRFSFSSYPRHQLGSKIKCGVLRMLNLSKRPRAFLPGSPYRKSCPLSVVRHTGRTQRPLTLSRESRTERKRVRMKRLSYYDRWTFHVVLPIPCIDNESFFLLHHFLPLYLHSAIIKHLLLSHMQRRRSTSRNSWNTIHGPSDDSSGHLKIHISFVIISKNARHLTVERNGLFLKKKKKINQITKRMIFGQEICGDQLIVHGRTRNCFACLGSRELLSCFFFQAMKTSIPFFSRVFRFFDKISQ